MGFLAPDTRPLVDRIAEIAERLEALQVEAEGPRLNARCTQVTADTALLEWDPIPGTVVYHTGRTGTDNRGNGITKIDDQADTMSRLFVWLKPGTEYRLFVTAIPAAISDAVTITTAGV